jgi:peptidoglycan-associated lipoprotein
MFLSVRLASRIATGVGATAALALMACSSTPEEKPAPPPTGSEFEQGREEVESMETRPSAAVNLDLQTVYFDFDKSNIRDDARPVLRADADKLVKAKASVTIEGHCDERGDEEYNLALGDRRASSVKRYLMDLGVPAAQMRTVSFGEAKPAVRGHDESAWRWNRRAEFRVN